MFDYGIWPIDIHMLKSILVQLFQLNNDSWVETENRIPTWNKGKKKSKRNVIDDIFAWQLKNEKSFRMQSLNCSRNGNTEWKKKRRAKKKMIFNSFSNKHIVEVPLIGE